MAWDTEYKLVQDLSEEELLELKYRYRDMLMESGEFEEVFGEDLNPEDVPDDVIFRNWEYVSFVEDDFWCNVEKEE